MGLRWARCRVGSGQGLGAAEHKLGTQSTAPDVVVISSIKSRGLIQIMKAANGGVSQNLGTENSLSTCCPGFICDFAQ